MVISSARTVVPGSPITIQRHSRLSTVFWSPDQCVTSCLELCTMVLDRQGLPDRGVRRTSRPVSEHRVVGTRGAAHRDTHPERAAILHRGGRAVRVEPRCRAATTDHGGAPARVQLRTARRPGTASNVDGPVPPRERHLRGRTDPRGRRRVEPAPTEVRRCRRSTPRAPHAPPPVAVASATGPGTGFTAPGAGACGKADHAAAINALRRRGDPGISPCPAQAGETHLAGP